MDVLNGSVADPAAAAALVSSTLPQQVSSTPAADELIARLTAKYGPVMFHQSGGCCDGSSPMCYPQGEFLTGDSDVLLGTVGAPTAARVPHSSRSDGWGSDNAATTGAPFYISRPQFEYWKHTHLILDVVPGRGGMFSLDNSEGVRFLIRSRIFTDDEIAALRAANRI